MHAARCGVGGKMGFDWGFVAREKWQEYGFFLRNLSSGGESDDFDAICGVKLCVWKVTGQDGLAIDFSHDRLPSKAEGGEQLGE